MSKGKGTAVASLAERFDMQSACQFIQERVGVPINIRTLRSWAEKGHIECMKGLGPRGHYFFTREMLERAAQKIRHDGQQT